MTQTDVLVVGGVGVDHVIRVDSLPLPVVDSFIVPPILTVPGHTGNGVALGVHALGRATAMIDVIGDDPEGQLIRSTYSAQGIPTTFVTHACGTRRAVNLVTPDGLRMSLYDPRRSGRFRARSVAVARGNPDRPSRARLDRGLGATRTAGCRRCWLPDLH